MSRAINYEKYTELLSRIIHGNATEAQWKQVAEFEAAQPKECEHCGMTVRSFIQPHRIAHDVIDCPAKSKADQKG